MKWIKLFESFNSSEKIEIANKIHAAWFIKKALNKSGLSILKGTREEHTKTTTYVINETYYYKKVRGEDKLLICLVEGGIQWDPYQRRLLGLGLDLKAPTEPNTITMCMDKPFRSALLTSYLKNCGKTPKTVDDRMFWTYCEYACARYFGMDTEKIEFFPIRKSSENNFKKLIAAK